MKKIIRLIVYEGEEGWLDTQVNKRSWTLGVHELPKGTITITDETNNPLLNPPAGFDCEFDNLI